MPHVPPKPVNLPTVLHGFLLWTAFGPTNVAIHRVATATELGDVQVAVDLGPRLDTSALPMERRVRHALEVARAYSLWNRVDDALDGAGRT